MKYVITTKSLDGLTDFFLHKFGFNMLIGYGLTLFESLDEALKAALELPSHPHPNIVISYEEAIEISKIQELELQDEMSRLDCDCCN